MDHDQLAQKENAMIDLTYREDDANYCIVGFFTPNYRAIAKRFSDNLREYDIPHHLVAYPTLPSWEAAILRKPEVLAAFMNSHPDRVHVLMDVDSVVRGPLTPLAEVKGKDALVTFYKRRSMKAASSRITVWFPTPASFRLVEAWHDECRTADIPCDEVCLTYAINGFGQGMAIEPVPEGYRGVEMNHRNKADIVVHWSAHDATRPWARIKKRTKFIKRRMVELFLGGKSYEEWKHGTSA